MEIETENIRNFEKSILSFMKTEKSDLMNKLADKKELTDDIKEELNSSVKQFMKSFNA
jgi:F-type H+-transporting ATPase subunit alpha